MHFTHIFSGKKKHFTENYEKQEKLMKDRHNQVPFLSPFLAAPDLLLVLFLYFSLHRNSPFQSSRPMIFQFYSIKSNLQSWRQILLPEKSYWAHKQMVHQRETPGINSCCPSRPFEIGKVKAESSKEVSDTERGR